MADEWRQAVTTADERISTEGEAQARERFRRNVVSLVGLAGISMRRAAGLADLSESTLRSWLAGEKDPTLGNLAKLADALGVDVGDLLLEPDALATKIAEVGLRPFVLRRPDTTSPPSRHGGRSAAARGKMGAKRTCSKSGSDLRKHRPATPGRPCIRRIAQFALAS